MRLLIDTNAYHKVFDPRHTDFHEFERLRECLFNRKGQLYYGGTTFLRELEKLSRFLNLRVELKKLGKLVELSKAAVDKEEVRLRKLFSIADFDDPHLVACCISGAIEIVVTNDDRSAKYLKDKVKGVNIYPKHISPPKIFKNKKNNRLLINCFR